MTWHDGRVGISASIEVARPVSGSALRDAYVDGIKTLTFGLARWRDNAVWIGPLEALRFGAPTLDATSVEWPIEGGLLAGAPGGAWRLDSSAGRLQAAVKDYKPSLPRPLYDLTHLQVHQLFTHLLLLHVRGRDPLPGQPATRDERLRAASIDIAFCLTLARLTGRRRWPRTLAITAVYHIACWSLTGQTIGGVVMRQRVVAVDGTLLTPAQSALRMALLPLSWITRRPVHDEMSGSSVINA